jgi:hypothetical protein
MAPRKRKPKGVPPLRQRPSGTPDDWIDPLWKPGSELELRFAQLWIALYPDIDLHTQYQFHPDRFFTFDFCHIPTRTAIEVNGGTNNPKMYHRSGSGIQSDYEKTQLAVAEGWLVIPISSNNSEDARILAHIAKTIRHRESQNAA